MAGVGLARSGKMATVGDDAGSLDGKFEGLGGILE
jgi:hypothetical protein